MPASRNHEHDSPGFEDYSSVLSRYDFGIDSTVVQQVTGLDQWDRTSNVATTASFFGRTDSSEISEALRAVQRLSSAASLSEYERALVIDFAGTLLQNMGVDLAGLPDREGNIHG